MDNLSSQQQKDTISELPDDILVDCLSSLDMKTAARTSILSKRWRYLWAHLSTLDFDPESMYLQEYYDTWNKKGDGARNYFAWIDQVLSVHRGASIDKFRVHTRYFNSYAPMVDKWVQFALIKRVKELVVDLFGKNMIGDKDHSIKGYPFGFDILRHPPCYTGLTTIQSLHLRYVDISDELLEFLLSHCHHLERLHLDSTSPSYFKIKSSKLKYLSILVLSEFKGLEIDAENLLCFFCDDANDKNCPSIAFKNVPALVETMFRGGLCQYPFPIFTKLSTISHHLCKLSLYNSFYTASGENLVIPEGIIPIFPNLKHLTCTFSCASDNSCILPLKRVVEACPKLEEFKLQISYVLSENYCEASELQDIDLEDNRDNVNLETGQVHKDRLENVNLEKQSHLNLRILEVVGFLGAECDVPLILDIVSYASSLKTIICDPRGVGYSFPTLGFYFSEMIDYNVVEKRARKLAKIVEPKVKVVII